MGKKYRIYGSKARGALYAHPIHPVAVYRLAVRTDMIAISFTRMLRAGPEVSLNGSPTVSPTTAALCGSLPLPPRLPDSLYFFALSHAPPLLDIDMPSKIELTSEPASRPPSASRPRSNPTSTGEQIARSPGSII